MLRGVLFIFWLWAAVANAGLVWQNPAQEFQRTPEDRELAVNFAFTNTGSNAVTITKVTSSCGCCTTADRPTKTYAPGESGNIAAKFTFGGRRGLQLKTFTVDTDDGKSTQLSFQCLILDDPVTLASSLVSWRVGEAAAAKEVEVAIAQKPEIEVTAVASSNPRIAASLAPAKGVGKYAISIQPADTAQPESGDIFVQTNYPAAGPKAYTIHVRIK